MPWKAANSTRLGSIRTMRTWSGVARLSTDMISELMQLDLPAPVAPATSRCGIRVRFDDHETAFDVLAQGDEHGVLIALCDRRPEHVAEHDDLGVDIRDLDAHGALARDRADDADVGALHRVGDVAGELSDALDLDSSPQRHLVASHGGTATEAGDRTVDCELGEHLLKRRDDLVVRLGMQRVRLAGPQFLERRQGVHPRAATELELDRLTDGSQVRLGGRLGLAGPAHSSRSTGIGQRIAGRVVGRTHRRRHV